MDRFCCYTEKQPFTSIRWYKKLIACIKENPVTIQTDSIPDETIYPETAVPFSEIRRSTVFEGRFVAHLATFLTSLTVSISFGVSQKDTSLSSDSLIIQCIPDVLYVLGKANRATEIHHGLYKHSFVWISKLTIWLTLNRRNMGEEVYRSQW